MGKDIYNMFADLGDWLNRKSKKDNPALVIGILSIIAPLGLIFIISFIFSANRRGKK
ncbi:MAG TPA: hypothetical protein VJH34_00530 [archaeon]|nr:hypothetical protein [archaeon]